jgi:type III pantothenate kinase
MNIDLVADVGNSRIKWGFCRHHAVTDVAALPPDDERSWKDQLARWQGFRPLCWAVTGVHPERRERLVAWLRERGDVVRVIDVARELPLRVLLEHPDRVGIDRLFDAVAANTRRTAGTPAVVVDAGSAVTVDWLDANGAFGGGAILPGLRLMAQALHDYTALLPQVEVPATIPDALGTRTIAAMEAGVFWAVIGGIQALVAQLARRTTSTPEVFLTGGDAAVLGPALRELPGGRLPVLWPQMTLEGIRISAEALP